MNTPLVSRSGAKQISRFVVVGFVNVAVSFALFELFYRHVPLSTLLQSNGSLGTKILGALHGVGAKSIDAGVAYMLGCLGGMVTSFVLNKRWTFEARGFTGSQARRFVILNVLCIGGTTLLLSLLVDLLHAPYLPVWIGMTGLAMVVNFLANRYWTFAPPGFNASSGSAPHGRM
jgi:putative flippase GtrA